MKKIDEEYLILRFKELNHVYAKDENLAEVLKLLKSKFDLFSFNIVFVGNNWLIQKME